MPINWKKNLTQLVKTAGQLCQATVNGNDIQFYGIYDVESIPATDPDGQLTYIQGRTLIVENTIAAQVDAKTPIVIDINGCTGAPISFRMSDKLPDQGDGALWKLIMKRDK